MNHKFTSLSAHINSKIMADSQTTNENHHLYSAPIHHSQNFNNNYSLHDQVQQNHFSHSYPSSFSYANPQFVHHNHANANANIVQQQQHHSQNSQMSNFIKQEYSNSENNNFIDQNSQQQFQAQFQQQHQHLQETENQNDLPDNDPSPDLNINLNIKIHNVFCKFITRCHINLRKLALSAVNTDLDKRRSKVVICLKEPRLQASIYAKGTVIITAQTSESKAHQGARVIARMIQKSGCNVRMTGFEIANVFATCKLPFFVELSKFYSGHRCQELTYEPELHAAANYKFGEGSPAAGANLKIFSTGSVTATAPNCEILQIAMQTIYPILEKFHKPGTMVSPVEHSLNHFGENSQDDENDVSEDSEGDNRISNSNQKQEMIYCKQEAPEIQNTQITRNAVQNDSIYQRSNTVQFTRINNTKTTSNISKSPHPNSIQQKNHQRELSHQPKKLVPKIEILENDDAYKQNSNDIEEFDDEDVEIDIEDIEEADVEVSAIGKNGSKNRVGMEELIARARGRKRTRTVAFESESSEDECPPTPRRY